MKLRFGLGFDSLDNRTKKLCLYFTLYSANYTVCYTEKSLVYQEQWEGKDKRKNYFKILTLIVQNLALKILSTHSFCWGFSNHVCQRNKLKSVHALQCTLYTVHYVPYRQEFSTLETSQERGHMGEMLLWLISKLGLISTLGKLNSVLIIYKHCY